MTKLSKYLVPLFTKYYLPKNNSTKLWESASKINKYLFGYNIPKSSEEYKTMKISKCVMFPRNPEWSGVDNLAAELLLHYQFANS